MRSNGPIGVRTAKIRRQTKRFFQSRSPLESSPEKRTFIPSESTSHGEGIEPYLRQIGNAPLLSKEEEFRQFEHAKQNFQEDIEKLQSKQNELKQFKDQLKKMKSTIDQKEKRLPKHLPQERAKSESPSRGES